MSDTSRLRQLSEELSRTIVLRRELAVLEIAHDRRLITRGAVVGGFAVIATIIGLTLLLCAVAEGLASDTISATLWTVIFGAVLFIPGFLLLARTIHQCRTRFCGLQATLAELNEDLIWLREWVQTTDEERPE